MTSPHWNNHILRRIPVQDKPKVFSWLKGHDTLIPPSNPHDPKPQFSGKSPSKWWFNPHLHKSGVPNGVLVKFPMLGGEIRHVEMIILYCGWASEIRITSW